MNITRMKTNRLDNPLGFDLSKLTLSWNVEDTPSTRSTATRVEIATDPDFAGMVSDSGFVAGISGIAYHPDITLSPRTRYFWRVTVRGNKGDEFTSPAAWFETSKMDEPWRGKWVTPDLDSAVNPYLRKGFELPSAIKSARLYASGVGVYEVEINGAKVGDEFLAPGFHSYDRWVQYQTYDVSAMLAAGSNAIGVMLGEGWAKGRFGFDGVNHAVYCDRIHFICELRVTLDDGADFVLGSDGSWSSYPSGITFSNIYDGEHIDARLMVPGWSGMRFDDSGWSGVLEREPSLGALSPRLSPPVMSKHLLKPVEVITTPVGETVLDMGQNLVGWLTFTNTLPEGETLKLTFGEILQNDCFYTENLRTAKQEFIYISDGTPSLVRPRFTFYGFRYVKVEGLHSQPSCDDFTAHVLYSDLEQTGHIETSNPDVNRLFQNALWGQRGNFLDVPTDCPQRDERMGWTGDAQVFSGTALFNMDSYAFYKKFLRDTWEEQQKYDGAVPVVVPYAAAGFIGDLAMGAVAWADCATVIPWNIYLHTGDTAILESSFDSMKAWVDWVTEKDGGNGGLVWAKSFHFGDWLALDNYKNPSAPTGGTENGILCAAYYHYSAGLVSKAAAVLGKTDLAKQYSTLADEILEVIRREYVTPSGRLAVPTQTAHVVALYLGLTPDSRRTAQDLLALLVDTSNFGRAMGQERPQKLKLTTGFIGTPWLCRTLSAAGNNAEAYTLFLNDELPSWLYAVKMGATTIWERWNSVLPDGSISDTGMNSLNHYSYGSIVEWMYRDMCGINPVEDRPGFAAARIAPLPDPRLGYARCSLLTAAGRYKSGWQYLDDGSIRVDLSVPFDAEATLVLSDARMNGVIGPAGLKARQKGKRVEFTLPSGDYCFTYTPLALDD